VIVSYTITAGVANPGQHTLNTIEPRQLTARRRNQATPRQPHANKTDHAIEDG
jgi:hypothetical protein